MITSVKAYNLAVKNARETPLYLQIEDDISLAASRGLLETEVTFSPKESALQKKAIITALRGVGFWVTGNDNATISINWEHTDERLRSHESN